MLSRNTFSRAAFGHRILALKDMKSNIIKINDYMPPKGNTVLKVIMYPEKQATVRPMKEQSKVLEGLKLKHPDLPECNNLSHKDRVLF